MQRITLLCVGKLKETFYAAAAAEYVKRLSRYCKLELVQVADEKTPDGASPVQEKQIKEKMDEIIEFSELGNFIDKPVKTYSSGMYSKLAFSITAILETEIMLIDEVLSVGDAKFKKKSYKKMKSLINQKNRTVIIVSHSSDTLRKLCDTILWLHDGEIKMLGSVDEVLPVYEEFMS